MGHQSFSTMIKALLDFIGICYSTGSRFIKLVLVTISCVGRTSTPRIRVTHIYVDEVVFIGSDTDLSPFRRLAIIWTNAVFVSNGPLGNYLYDIWIRIQNISFKNTTLKYIIWDMVAISSRPQCVTGLCDNLLCWSDIRAISGSDCWWIWR